MSISLRDLLKTPEEIKTYEKEVMASCILPTSKEYVEFTKMKGMHVQLAQKTALENPTLLVPYMLSMLCKFEGRDKTMTQILDLPAEDYFTLSSLYNKCVSILQSKAAMIAKDSDEEGGSGNADSRKAS